MAQLGWTGRRAAALGLALAMPLAAGAMASLSLPALGQPLPAPGGATKDPAPAPPRPGRAPAQAAPAAPPAPAAPAIALSAAEAARTPPLQPDVPVRLNLRRGQQAFFRVAPEVGEAWTVTTRRLGRNTDTVLAVLDDAGTVVAEDDDGGEESLSSRIEIQPGENGRLVRAGTLEDAGGRFEVVLARAEVLPPPDFATTQAEAASRPPLEPGQSRTVRLRRGQSGFFALPADRANLIAVTRELGRGVDTVLALLDAEGRTLAEDDDGGEGLASLLSVAEDAPGPLTLRAGLIGNGPGSFQLVLEREPPSAPPDYPTSLEAARARGPVAAGQTLRVELGRGGRAFFALPEGEALTLATRNLTSDADTVLALLDSAGGVIAEDDDGGGGLASRIATAGRPAAFVRATLLNGARGGFDLVVTGAAAPSAGSEAAGSLEEAARRPTLLLGEAIRVRVEGGAPSFIALPFDGRPAIAMTFGLGSEVDTVLALVDAGGTVMAENDDAEGLASRIEIPAQGAPAFLRLRVLGDRGGEFSVVLVRPAP